MYKKMQYALIILVQGFCPLNIKITQLPGEFCLNVIFQRRLITIHNMFVMLGIILLDSMQTATGCKL